MPGSQVRLWHGDREAPVAHQTSLNLLSDAADEFQETALKQFKGFHLLVFHFCLLIRDLQAVLELSLCKSNSSQGAMVAQKERVGIPSLAQLPNVLWEQGQGQGWHCPGCWHSLSRGQGWNWPGTG